MAAMIWIGALLAGLGVLALLYCIVVAVRARRQGLEGTAMEAKLRRLVALNLGALALSGLGLMILIVGILLG